MDWHPILLPPTSESSPTTPNYSDSLGSTKGGGVTVLALSSDDFESRDAMCRSSSKRKSLSLQSFIRQIQRERHRKRSHKLHMLYGILRPPRWPIKKEEPPSAAALCSFIKKKTR
ncbi:hypothetical protein BHM03_00020725 [Ensete ventricosum]|nr:hypothetical protein BHM03_00020725 [Ensete ventricosum]